MRKKLTDVFGYADQENITYELGYTLTLERKISTDPIIRDNAIAVAEKGIKETDWYIPHFTPLVEIQQFVMNHLLNKDPTELYYTERMSFKKGVKTNNNRTTFELGHSGESTPTHSILSFQAKF